MRLVDNEKICNVICSEPKPKPKPKHEHKSEPEQCSTVNMTLNMMFIIHEMFHMFVFFVYCCLWLHAIGLFA